jgi:hypothetical protein
MMFSGAGIDVLFGGRIPARRPPGVILHRVPEVPVVIDGEDMEPKAVRDFINQPLHTVLDQEAQDGGSLKIFPRWQAARDHFLRSAPEQSSPPPQGGFVNLYENINFAGCEWHYPEWNGTLGDFRKLWCGWSWWYTADNRVSSVDCFISHPPGGKSAVILCEFFNLGGSWFWIPGELQVASLVPFGWNDRASSLQMMYF